MSAEIWRTAAQAVGRWLEENGRLQRPISSLSIEELEGVAMAAVSGWQDARIAQAKAEGDTAKVNDLFEA